MDNLFSDLEVFGLNNLSSMNIYDEKAKEEGQDKKMAADKASFCEEDIIFDKTYECPVCDREFKAKTIKSGKIKLLNLDNDLRPRYHLFDPLKYDAIICPYCGFAALNRFFKYVTSTQADLIKKHISASFKGIKESEGIYSYDDAIVRHKLALVNAIVKKSKVSERAYTCLKTAWVIRGKAENTPYDTPGYEEIIAGLQKDELEFLRNAYEGFAEAYEKESFPMCGMDEITINLLMGELARRIGRIDEASKWISKVLISREANERIKQRARDIKDLIREDKMN